MFSSFRSAFHWSSFLFSFYSDFLVRKARHSKSKMTLKSGQPKLVSLDSIEKLITSMLCSQFSLVTGFFEETRENILHIFRAFVKVYDLKERKRYFINVLKFKSLIKVKFIYFEKVKKFCEISTNYLSYLLPVK